MSIFVRSQSETRPDVRAFLIATEDNPPALKYFRLEIKEGDTWRQTRKIDAELFEKYAKRLGIDAIEAQFVLEEAAERMEKQREGL